MGKTMLCGLADLAYDTGSAAFQLCERELVTHLPEPQFLHL